MYVYIYIYIHIYTCIYLYVGRQVPVFVRNMSMEGQTTPRICLYWFEFIQIALNGSRIGVNWFELVCIGLHWSALVWTGLNGRLRLSNAMGLLGYVWTGGGARPRSRGAGSKESDAGPWPGATATQLGIREHPLDT